MITDHDKLNHFTANLEKCDIFFGRPLDLVQTLQTHFKLTKILFRLEFQKYKEKYIQIYCIQLLYKIYKIQIQLLSLKILSMIWIFDLLTICDN